MKTVVSDRVPPEVCGDEMRVRQILTNLVSNAIKFTDAGSVEILADLVECEADTSTVCIKVKDTGIGIERERQRKLFQPFVQVDSSISRKFGGTGLGLSISKSFVDLMGGTIAVESLPEQGSTFVVTIPFVGGDDSPCRR